MVRLLVSRGFFVIGQRGSHIKLGGVKDGDKRIVIIPDHRIIKPGTLRNICKQSGIDPHSLRSLLM